MKRKKRVKPIKIYTSKLIPWKGKRPKRKFEIGELAEAQPQENGRWLPVVVIGANWDYDHWTYLVRHCSFERSDECGYNSEWLRHRSALDRLAEL